MNRLIEFFAKQRLFSDLLTIAVIVIGIVSVFRTQREVFPNVTFDFVSVTTVFQGASADEVEKLITNPLEQDLKEVDGVKKIISNSTEGLSDIGLEIDPDQTDVEKAKSDIQDVVDRFNDLPENAMDPVVTKIETKLQPAIEVSVSGPVTETELRTAAKFLEKELKSIPGVARVPMRGYRDVEYHVEADLKKLANYRLTLDELSSSLKKQNVSIPGGTIEPLGASGNQNERLVRTTGAFNTLADIEKTVVRANDLGDPILLKDVAKVKSAFERDKLLSRTNGNPAINLVVMKKEKADAIVVVDQTKKHLNDVAFKMDPRIRISYINDFSIFIERRLDILVGNLIIGLVLVLIVLSLLLPIRVAFIVALGIPFSFLGTMTFFNFANISINIISVVGLIIVVGMLVDDAIVVTENSVRLIEEGKDPEDAAVSGTIQIWRPVAAAVLTTIFAFLPLMFIKGMMGKFVHFIPLGVISALVFSLFEAYFVLPRHIARWIKKDKRSVATAKTKLGRSLVRSAAFWDLKVVPAYVKLLTGILNHRYKVIAAVLVVFFGTAFIAGKAMKFVFAPPGAIEIFYVKTKAPVGTPLIKTVELMKFVEKAIAALPKEELQDFVTLIGAHQESALDPNSKWGSELAQIVVYLTPEEDRKRKAPQIVEALKKQIGLPPGFLTISFDEVHGGPPMGKAVDMGVRADNYEDILPAVGAVKSWLNKQKGVSSIQDTYQQGKDEYRVEVNAAEAAAAGLSAASIGNTVRAAFDGFVATSITTLDEEIDIRVMLPKQQRSDVSVFDKIEIPNMQGHLIPLMRVAKVKKTSSLASLPHQDNERQIRVTAAVDSEVTSARDVNRGLDAEIEKFKKDFPKVTFKIGGEMDDTKESMGSLGYAFLIAAFAIFLILVLTMGQLLQPILILLTIPLGFIAVVWTFLLHREPLSFMAFMGIVALGGVVVNNAIILVDFINQERLAGVGLTESIISAARTRLRPIFLTTVTTVVGILPTAYGIGGLDKFIVPIALAIGWGLFFGSILTIIVFPASIAILDDIKGLIRRKLGRKSAGNQEAIIS